MLACHHNRWCCNWKSNDVVGFVQVQVRFLSGVLLDFPHDSVIVDAIPPHFASNAVSIGCYRRELVGSGGAVPASAAPATERPQLGQLKYIPSFLFFSTTIQSLDGDKCREQMFEIFARHCHT